MQEQNDGQISPENHVLDYILVLARRKKMIFKTVFGIMFMVAIYSLIITPRYKAETRIFPPSGASTSLASQVLSSIGGGDMGLLGGMLGVKNPVDIYIGMIKSATLLGRVVDRHDLVKYYESEYRSDAVKTLLERVEVTASTGSILVLTVMDKEPEMAAEIANGIVDELKALSLELAVTQASQRRLFFEVQLKKAHDDLSRAEEAMQEFQEQTGAIMIQDQARALVEYMASLKAIIASKEVQLKVMRTYATEQNPDLRRTEEELSALREQLKNMEVNSVLKGGDDLAANSVPSLGTDYARKLRDLKYNETLYELMARQYELAKVEEAGDTAMIQVLDRALPPDRRYSPNRKLMVLVAGFFGSIIAVLAAFVAEYFFVLAETPGQSERVRALRESLRLKDAVRRFRKNPRAFVKDFWKS